MARSAARSRPRAARSPREKVDVSQDLADDQRVLALEATLERLAQRGDLLAQLPTRELGEHDRVARARHERVEHVAAGLAHDVAGHAAELDPGVLEDLVQPGGFALTVIDLRLAITR